MCTITRSKRNSADTTKTKTNEKACVSNDSLNDFLVKFVEENVTASIHGLHGCVDKGSAEPTQFSLELFFSSMGGMSQLSHMQKLKCAMVVSDNLHRILCRLLVNQKRKEKTALNNSPPEKIALEFDSSEQQEKLFRLCRVKMPFAFVFDDQDKEVVETIGRMHKEIELQLENDGGAADTWDVFRKKMRSARKMVEVFLSNERSKLPKSKWKRTTNFSAAFATRWMQLETHLDPVLTNKHSLDQIEKLVLNHHSEGGVDHVGRKGKKRMASKSTHAKHAKPIEAFVAVQPSARKKRKKVSLPEKSRGEAPMEQKARERTMARKKQSKTSFGGETQPHKPESCQAVIVIETFRRGNAVVKGMTFEEEKSCGPGDFNCVAGKKHNKKLNSVLICDTTLAHLHAFKRADLKPHFVLPTKKAAEHIVKIVNGEIMEESA